MTTKTRKQPRRYSAVSELMGETINYGGIAATRADAYSHALDCCLSQLDGQPDRDRRARLGAEQFAFGVKVKALAPEESARLIPWARAVACGLLD